MLVILSRQTVLAPRSLVGRMPPRQVLGRGTLPVPRGTVTRRVFWRALFEMSLPRYLAALLPFLVAMLVQPNWALALAQAPLPMFGLVYLIETRVLAIPSPEKRRALIDPAEAARGLDLLAVRGRRILSGIAAGRGLTEGALTLVVEQSGMARVAPLTIVSVQTEKGPSYLDLDEGERAAIAGLFADGLDERLLQRINLSEDRFVRTVVFEAKAVSAHARLAAMATRNPA